MVLLDPFQNIVNVNWTGKRLVAGATDGYAAGVALYSADGTHWKPISGFPGGCMGMASTNGLWVGLSQSNNNINKLVSSDFSTWTGGGSLKADAWSDVNICAGKTDSMDQGIFLVGESGTSASVLSSVDGKSWNSVLTATHAQWNVWFAAKKFFAFRNYKMASSDDQPQKVTVYVSDDGQAWTNVGTIFQVDASVDQPQSPEVFGLAAGNNVIVAIGTTYTSDNEAFFASATSSDGMSWSGEQRITQVDSFGGGTALPSRFNHSGLAFGNKKFQAAFAFGLAADIPYNAIAFTSEMGSGWSQNSTVSSNSRFVASPIAFLPASKGTDGLFCAGIALEASASPTGTASLNTSKNGGWGEVYRATGSAWPSFIGTVDRA